MTPLKYSLLNSHKLSINLRYNSLSFGSKKSIFPFKSFPCFKNFFFLCSVLFLSVYLSSFRTVLSFLSITVFSFDKKVRIKKKKQIILFEIKVKLNKIKKKKNGIIFVSQFNKSGKIKRNENENK